MGWPAARAGNGLGNALTGLGICWAQICNMRTGPQGPRGGLGIGRWAKGMGSKLDSAYSQNLMGSREQNNLGVMSFGTMSALLENDRREGDLQAENKSSLGMAWGRKHDWAGYIGEHNDKNVCKAAFQRLPEATLFVRSVHALLTQSA